jgi:CBS domain-containing protein
LDTSFSSYIEIKEWKDEQLKNHLQNTHTLNEFHDFIIKNVIILAKKKTGVPTCDYVFFLTGSGGRIEQGLYSDQDHGIVYIENTEVAKEYFLQLGKEISDGLNQVGYPYCEGNVMSSNPLWCISLDGWKRQLGNWMDKASWTSIRNLQIFYDARTIMGEDQLVTELKSLIHDYVKKNPLLLKRLMENVEHFKNTIGPFGQILIEEKGKYHGCIDLKYSAFIPYVNAIRILSVKEAIHETSTENRMLSLLKNKPYASVLKDYYFSYKNLLQIRVNNMKEISSYVDAHYLNVTNLSKVEKTELKHILKNAKHLHQYVIALIEKGVKNGF